MKLGYILALAISLLVLGVGETATCIQSRRLCRRNSSCCSGKCKKSGISRLGFCRKGSFASSCLKPGAECWSWRQCCSRNCRRRDRNEPGRCAHSCLLEGNQCRRNSQCCSKKCNVVKKGRYYSGTCAPVCLMERAKCKTDKDCCSKLCDLPEAPEDGSSSSGTCISAGKFCSALGQRCWRFTDCCGGTNCYYPPFFWLKPECRYLR